MKKMFRSTLKVIFIALGALFFVSCNSSSDSVPPVDTNLVAYKAYPNAIPNMDNMTPDELSENVLNRLQEAVIKQMTPNVQQLATDAQVQAQTNLEEILKILWGIKKRTRNLFVYAKITYSSTDANGNVINNLTGVAIRPLARNPLDYTKVPVLVYQHPTQVEREQSPSKILERLDFSGDQQFTLLINSLFAASGYLVLIPDYTGMGDNYDAHPYCEKSLANAAADMIKAARSMPSNFTHAYVDFDNVSLIGYSEGGYATLITAKYLQEHNRPAKAVAALAGPHSLSESMKDLIINADAKFESPYFLPYVINGYDAAYGNKYEEIKFRNSVLREVPNEPNFNIYLLQMLTGHNTADQISAYMRKATPYNGPSSILVPSFKAMFADPESNIAKLLKENDSFRGWTPNKSTPIWLIHNENDETVPASNSQKAFQYFIANNALHVKYEPFTETLPLSNTVHVNAAPHAILFGYLNIDKVIYGR